MNPPDLAELRARVLEANRRVHARENARYLTRHPEQTNAFQKRILKRTVRAVGRELPAGARVLDLGCGTGYLSLPFLERGCRVTGVDLSPEMLEALDARIPEACRDRIRTVEADAESFLAEEAETYDAVLLSALLHHLVEVAPVVRRACARLKPGGLFLVFFEPLKQAVASPGRFAWHRALARMDEGLYRGVMRLRRVPLFDDEYEESDYQRRFGGIDPGSLAATLEDEGLTVLEVEKYSARRFAGFAFLGTRLLRTPNTFNLLARKNDS